MPLCPLQGYRIRINRKLWFETPQSTSFRAIQCNEYGAVYGVRWANYHLLNTSSSSRKLMMAKPAKESVKVIYSWWTFTFWGYGSMDHSYNTSVYCDGFFNEHHVQHMRKGSLSQLPWTPLSKVPHTNSKNVPLQPLWQKIFTKTSLNQHLMAKHNGNPHPGSGGIKNVQSRDFLHH